MKRKNERKKNIKMESETERDEEKTDVVIFQRATNLPLWLLLLFLLIGVKLHRSLCKLSHKNLTNKTFLCIFLDDFVDSVPFSSLRQHKTRQQHNTQCALFAWWFERRSAKSKAHSMYATIKTVVAFGYSANGCCNQIHPLAILMEILFIRWLFHCWYSFDYFQHNYSG